MVAHLPADFNPAHYRTLNPDLQALNDSQLRDHWLKTGYQQARLYHPKQLKVVAEFGQELLCYTCYYYYLHKKGLLFDNQIHTYQGMRPYYWFLKPGQLLEENRTRKFLPLAQRPLLFNQDEHVRNFDYKRWYPPPLRQKYKQQLKLNNAKPLLIIHNKYNREWGGEPVNFIPVELLLQLVQRLSDKYQLVYLRPRTNERGFSKDHNTAVTDFNDYEQLPLTVWTYDSLAAKFPQYTYNELKVRLYANCSHFIGVQGGGSHYSAFFGGKQLILHVRGQEARSGCYQGWYQKLSTELPLTLKVVHSRNDLLNSLDLFL